ncbi:MAG TPA: hypothetical protein PKE65_03530 [Rhizobiaceae bacterium]|nr:hypothetical protein [Rhizobiaceae bacterium]
MTLAMRMTLDGLLRALRWRAFGIAERASEATSAKEAGARNAGAAGANRGDSGENRR